MESVLIPLVSSMGFWMATIAGCVVWQETGGAKRYNE